MSSLHSFFQKKNLFRFFFSLFIGIGLLLFVYRSIDITDLSSFLLDKSIRWEIIIVSVFVGVLANFFRGLRWRLLIQPFSTPSPKRSNVILVSWGCFSINMLFPRAGEVWRCTTLARREQLPFSKLLGSLFMDRVMDMLVILLLFIACVLSFRTQLMLFFVGQNSWRERFHVWLSSSQFWLLIAVVVVSITFGFVWMYKRNLWQKIKKEMRMVLEGFRSIRSLASPWLFLLYTIAMWLCYYYAFQITFEAFSFTESLSWDIAFLSFVMGTIGVVVPVQSGIGAWHFMIITTLGLFGIVQQDAGVFALVVHTFQTLGNALVGFFAILVLPLLNKNYNRTAK